MRHFIKTLIILSFALAVSISSYSQLTLANLTKYIRSEYDVLDENLTKQGFRFYRQNSVEGQQSYMWTHTKNGNGFRVIVQQDTISIRESGNYTGYSNVNKFGLNYFTYNQVHYTAVLTQMKTSGFKKVTSKIQGTAIMTEYENDDFYVDFIKDNSGNKTMFIIKVIDKSYEIFDINIKGDDTKIRHSKKRIKPFSS